MRLRPIIAVVVVAHLSSASSQASAQRADSLVLWYPFDAPTDPVTDASGHGINGVFVNMTVDDYTGPGQGRCGRAIDFGDYDGANYIEILSDTAFTSLTANNAYTVAWFQMLPAGQDPPSQTNFRASGPDMDRVINSHAPWSNGQIYHDVNFNDASIRTRVNDPMPDGTVSGVWTHIALTKHQGEVGIWVNGELLDSNDGTAAPLVDINAWRIGAQANGLNDTAGLMDEFAVWDVALSAEEIYWLANSCPPTPPVRLSGDVNENGVTNREDFNVISQNFGNSPAESADGDLNRNNVVDLEDFRIWKNNDGCFIEGNAVVCPGALAANSALPEPTGFALLTIAGCGGVLWRRRRSHQYSLAEWRRGLT